ncbi:MAG: hypothetical protein EU539_08890, partial [Promethearchaeota archaeon]
MNQDGTSHENISAFIALWDKIKGVRILDHHPTFVSKNHDIDLIALKIFSAFQNLYQKEEEVDQIKKTFFVIPIKNINKKALVYIDTLVEKKDHNYPFIIVFLFPDYLSELDLHEYKNSVYEIGAEYFKEGGALFRKHYQDILEKFKSRELVKDADISIKPTYTLQEALLDFRKGLEDYSKEDYEGSYFLIKKAYLKFIELDKSELLIKSNFYLSSILLKLKKYEVAGELLRDLEKIS